MKFKSMISACVLLFAFAASNAEATECSLYVASSYYNYGQPIAPGQSFSYNIDIPRFIFPGPLWSTFEYDLAHLTVAFYGTGISSAGAGEAYPGTYSAPGFYNLGGFYNPGGYAGTYERYAVVRWPQGGVYCTTNSVNVVLQ